MAWHSSLCEVVCNAMYGVSAVRGSPGLPYFELHVQTHTPSLGTSAWTQTQPYYALFDDSFNFFYICTCTYTFSFSALLFSSPITALMLHHQLSQPCTSSNQLS